MKYSDCIFVSFQILKYNKEFVQLLIRYLDLARCKYTLNNSCTLSFTF